ncbi:RusA family crossover junction endodeoxyribonuclease [Corynebacterium sp. HMSC08A12]|uniref:RusA family crossover junction endodeoxyribonuclease n=1 Tax=Corynebacterium sp. HMSC08A12 TaxID=1581134 RepID=UPI001FED86DF|nr:RusA family crossover junction endodeoxyribonuclease [Corynebacterium sp. HMSC08A12]
MIKIVGTPAAQGSKTAYNRGGRCVLVETSKKLKPWREQVAKQAATYYQQPLGGAVSLTAVFIMPRTKAMGTKPAPHMVQKPDLDKLLRALNDGLTGIAFHDDSQVVEIKATKRRAEPGEEIGVEVDVAPIG